MCLVTKIRSSTEGRPTAEEVSEEWSVQAQYIYARSANILRFKAAPEQSIC